jgi:hypothetical protein
MAPKQRSPRELIRRESPHIDILLDDDIEEPLLPQTEAEEAMELGGLSTATAATSARAAVAEPYVQHVPWPALRRSSVSVRKVSPVVGFDPNEVSRFDEGRRMMKIKNSFSHSKKGYSLRLNLHLRVSCAGNVTCA